MSNTDLPPLASKYLSPYPAFPSPDYLTSAATKWKNAQAASGATRDGSRVLPTTASGTN